MRGPIACVLGGMMALLGLRGPAPSAELAESKSALETDPKGWVDLLPGKDLKGWKRVPIPPDEKLVAKDAWSVDVEGKLLICDGVGVKEMLLQDQERGDGVFHVEWRFKKTDAKVG